MGVELIALNVQCHVQGFLHVETFHWIILQIIYRTRDILYLIYSEGACQFKSRLNIDTPLHCKSNTNYHLFCKYNICTDYQRRGALYVCINTNTFLYMNNRDKEKHEK